MKAFQLNPCIYCMDVHTDEAAKIHETRIEELENWKTSTVLTKGEKLALQLT